MHQYQVSLQDLSPLPVPNRSVNSINPQIIDFLILDLKNNPSNTTSAQASNNQGYPNPYHSSHNNDLLFQEVPSTLLQLPSVNNFGSSVFDDSRRDNCQHMGFNTNHLNMQSDLLLNRCQSGTIIPDINEFSHQILPSCNINNTLADIDSVNYKFDSVGMERKKELPLDTEKMPEGDSELKQPLIQDLLKQYPNQLFSQMNPPFSPQQQESAHSLLAKFSQTNNSNILPSNFLTSLPFLAAGGGANPFSSETQQPPSSNLTATPSTIPTPTSFSSISSVGQSNKVAQVSNSGLIQNSTAFSNSINSSIMAELLKKSQEKNEQKGSNLANNAAERNQNSANLSDSKTNRSSVVSQAAKSATEGTESAANLINNLSQITSIKLPLKAPQRKSKQASETNTQQPPTILPQAANIPEENEEDELKMEEYARKVDFCKCRKSKCLKLYCECFLRGTFCNEQCICTECGNTAGNEGERLKAIEEAKCRNAEAFNLKFQKSENEVSHKRGCNCKKTNCLKKYCECYNAGLKCKTNCKCEECKNTQDNLKSLGESAAAKLTEEQQQLEESRNSQEVSVLFGISATASIPQRERKISMSQSASSSTILQNRKRTRSEALDQGSLTAADEDDAGVRKKKSQFHAQQAAQQEEQQEQQSIQQQQPIQAQGSKSSQQTQPSQKNTSLLKSQTNYNSFQQNFVFPETTKHANPSAKKQA